MGFAENLKEIRNKRNITQEQLAEILSVSRQTISKWESGLGYPETEKLLYLSKELNVSLDYLFSDRCHMVRSVGSQRVSKIDTYLNCAEVFAYRSTCLKRKYGAVIGQMPCGNSPPQRQGYDFANHLLGFGRRIQH